MATWTLQKRPFPHLRITATTREGQSLRISETGMMRTQPGWYMHLPDLARQSALILHVSSLPPAIRRSLELQAAAVASAARDPRVVVALYFASDMEDHGWYRPNVEAHETQHGIFHTFAFDPSVPGRTARFESQLLSLLPALQPYLQPYLNAFSSGTAVDEFLADLAGTEASFSSGLSFQDAIRTCGRNSRELTGAWNKGLRAGPLFAGLVQGVLKQEAASAP